MATVVQYAPWNSLPVDFSLDSADDMVMTSVLDTSLSTGKRSLSFTIVRCSLQQYNT